MNSKAAVLTVDAGQFERPEISFVALIARLRERWAKRRTSRLLAELDDYMLEDIGFETGRVRRSRTAMANWVVQSHSGTARLVFIGH